MNEQFTLTETHYGDSPYRPDVYGILIPGKRGRLCPCCIPPRARDRTPPYCCCTASPALCCDPLRRAVQAAGGTQFRSETYPTDHFWSDHRLTIAQTVTEFLTRD